MRWSVVHTAYSRPDAEVVAAILRGNGFEVFVSGDDAGGMGPELAFSNGIQVKVPEPDHDRAVQILSSTR